MTGRSRKPQLVIRAPRDGTVVRDNGVEGTVIPAGAQLAVAFDLAESYVTARIDETDVRDVRIGQQVDLTLESAGGRTLVGQVRDIEAATNALVAPTPQRNTVSSFERGTQRVPVKISIIDWRGVAPVVGMNATVKIHKY